MPLAERRSYHREVGQVETSRSRKRHYILPRAITRVRLTANTKSGVLDAELMMGWQNSCDRDGGKCWRTISHRRNTCKEGHNNGVSCKYV